MKMAAIVGSTIIGASALAGNQCEFLIYGQHAGVEINELAAPEMQVVHTEFGIVSEPDHGSVFQLRFPLAISRVPLLPQPEK